PAAGRPGSAPPGDPPRTTASPARRPRPRPAPPGRAARAPPCTPPPRPAPGSARTRRAAPPGCAGSRRARARSRTRAPGPAPWGRMVPSRPMRVTAISDVHGAVEHLPAVARDCDALLVLGDLINILDYRTWDGILVQVFGRDPVVQ